VTVYNLGSIVADNFYGVPHIPSPGEAVKATSVRRGLGGKGANQSVAASKAGSKVVHIGCIGGDGQWLVQQLDNAGVDVTHIRRSGTATGHANITVDPSGENAIVFYGGANEDQSEEAIVAALVSAKPGDTLLLQNETSKAEFAAGHAKSKGMRVIYSAAPFEIEHARVIIPLSDIVAVNAVEAAQLDASAVKTGTVSLLVTNGAVGATYVEGANKTTVPSFDVVPVDTTGAGDTFLGYFAAGIDQSMPPAQALAVASAAAAIQVTRFGTAEAIPTRNEVMDFLEKHAD
jgi:ribokinase